MNIFPGVHLDMPNIYTFKRSAKSRAQKGDARLIGSKGGRPTAQKGDARLIEYCLSRFWYEDLTYPLKGALRRRSDLVI